MNWKWVGLVHSYYIDGLSLSVTDPATTQPVYYVSLQTENGAGRTVTSNSNPIYITQGDKAGNIIIEALKRPWLMGFTSSTKC